MATTPARARPSSNPISSRSVPPSRYRSTCTIGSRPPRYSWTNVKVGLVTSSGSIPRPAASPRTNAVFPVPKSPWRRSTSPGRRREASAAATARVWSSDVDVCVSTLTRSSWPRGGARSTREWHRRCDRPDRLPSWRLHRHRHRQAHQRIRAGRRRGGMRLPRRAAARAIRRSCRPTHRPCRRWPFQENRSG